MKKLGVFIPILLTIVLAFSMVPTAYAETVELFYDDGPPQDGWQATDLGNYLAVRFSLPSGWTQAKLLSVRYYLPDVIEDFNAHVFDSDGSTQLFGPLSVSPVSQGWFSVDLSSDKIVVSGDFYVAIEYTTAWFPQIGIDLDDPDHGRFYGGSPGSWGARAENCMIRAVIGEIGHPVGGIYTSTERLSILIPYIALVGLIGVLSTIFAIRRWCKD